MLFAASSGLEKRVNKRNVRRLSILIFRSIFVSDKCCSYVQNLTWIFKPEVWLWLGMFLVEYFLPDMLGEDLVEDVVDGQGQARLVDQELLHQE